MALPDRRTAALSVTTIFPVSNTLDPQAGACRPPPSLQIDDWTIPDRQSLLPGSNEQRSIWQQCQAEAKFY
jgi:hypothetical protein